jgi:hypothetical protein
VQEETNFNAALWPPMTFPVFFSESSVVLDFECVGSGTSPVAS